MNLVTERLRLRPVRHGDLDALVTLFADPQVMQFSLGLLDREQSREKLDRILANMELRGWASYVVETLADDEFVGLCGFAPQVVDEIAEVELGYRLMPAFWGSGIATEAAIACKTYGFETLGLPRIISIIEPDNVGSIRVAEKAGLVLEKETRKWERLVRIYVATAPSYSRTSIP